MEQNNKIVVYLISDYYNLLFYTDDPILYYECLKTYINTMATSKKENTWSIGSWFTTKEEYEIFKKNNKAKPSNPNRLTLVKGEDIQP